MLSPSARDPFMARVPQANLLAATVQCDALLAAILAIEGALQRSAGRVAPLSEVLRPELPMIRANIGKHVCDTEAPEGFLPKVEHERPRFARRAESLRCEHDQLESQLELLELALSGPTDEREVRLHAIELLTQLRKHLDRGAKLLFDAYVRDIGAGG